MDKLFASAQLKAINKKDGVYEVMVSSGKVDRLGDTIDPKGWYLTNYKKNPVILWSHSSGGFGSVALPPVGRAIKTWIQDEKELRQKQVFASTPFAQELKLLVDEECLNAQSVGFLPLVADVEKGDIQIEGKMYRRVLEIELKSYIEKGFVDIDGKRYSKDGQHFTKQELLEVSWVGVPALADALVSARKMGLSLMTKALENIKSKPCACDKDVEKITIIRPFPNEIKKDKVMSDKNDELVNKCVSEMEKAINVLKELKLPDKNIAPVIGDGRKPFVKQKSKKNDIERLLILFDKFCETLLLKLRKKDE